MSLKKIAEMVGVSPSTVSRVLNNTVSTCASPELKEKIWEAAHSLHYVPNSHARNLKTGSQSNSSNYKIAVILSRFHSLDTDPFFRELFQSIEESLFACSCLLHSVSTSEQSDLSSLTTADGVIILGRCSDDFLTQIRKYTRNIVGVDRNPTDYKMDEIICNGKTAAIKAMEHLLSLGHRKIGYIGDCSSESRYVGYCETLIARSIPLNYNYICSTDQTFDGGFLAMQTLLQQDITAVFCANDISALGALKALSELNLAKTGNRKMSKSDSRISVISIDNISLAQTSSPFLTTVNVPKEDMGRMAVTVLLDRIKHKHSECVRVEFPCKIVERDSCHPL
ncbi:MAG: LacI family transcriptional regulator [Lachnospiraceae bacterium]|nr:LacI family transcriptional regulator [Lachnospiraceae bacterium]